MTLLFLFMLLLLTICFPFLLWIWSPLALYGLVLLVVSVVGEGELPEELYNEIF